MLNYEDSMKKRIELIQEADDLMREYIRIADKMYSKKAGKYAGLLHRNVNHDGIEYEYYIDNWDYSAGRSYFYVSKEKLEENIEKHIRKEKLKKLK